MATWGVLGAPLSPGGAADTQGAGSEGRHLPARGSFQCPIPERRPSHWPLVPEARFISCPPSPPPLSPGPRIEGRSSRKAEPCTERRPPSPRLVSRLSTTRATRAASPPFLSSLCKHGITRPTLSFLCCWSLEHTLDSAQKPNSKPGSRFCSSLFGLTPFSAQGGWLLTGRA